MYTECELEVLTVSYIILHITCSFKVALEGHKHDDGDFLKVREKTTAEKVWYLDDNTVCNCSFCMLTVITV